MQVIEAKKQNDPELMNSQTKWWCKNILTNVGAALAAIVGANAAPT